MTLKPIGIIRTPYAEKDECPIQPLYDGSNLLGHLEIFEEYEAGLKDIETFSHIYLLYQFDRAGEIKLVRPTFLDDKEHGVFASRHPCRPNSIGMSIVKLKKTGSKRGQASGLMVFLMVVSFAHGKTTTDSCSWRDLSCDAARQRRDGGVCFG